MGMTMPVTDDQKLGCGWKKANTLLARLIISMITVAQKAQRLSVHNPQANRSETSPTTRKMPARIPATALTVAPVMAYPLTIVPALLAAAMTATSAKIPKIRKNIPWIATSTAIIETPSGRLRGASIVVFCMCFSLYEIWTNLGRLDKLRRLHTASSILLAKKLGE